MSHVKIHKHHFYTLIFSCLLFVWVTLHQTLANNDLLTMWGSTDKVEYQNTYSEEVTIINEEDDHLQLDEAQPGDEDSNLSSSEEEKNPSAFRLQVVAGLKRDVEALKKRNLEQRDSFRAMSSAPSIPGRA